MQRFQLQITKEMAGMRLDIALVNSELGLSRRKIRQIIDVGGVYVDGKRVRIASRMVERGSKIKVEYNLESLRKIKFQEFKLSSKDILFENDDVVVINKPPGLASQATRDQMVMHVVPVLKRFWAESNREPQNFVLVHRLDKETSGAMIVAKNNEVATWLTDCFRDRSIKKTYHAIVHGTPREEEFSVNCYLSSIQPRIGIVKIVKRGGKSSHTDFSVIERNVHSKLSLIEAKPQTGRSHQIRVHLDHAGFSIVGDKRYGRAISTNLNKKMLDLTKEHHFLHARRIEFRSSPSGEMISIEAAYPKNFALFLKYGLHLVEQK